MDSQGTMHIRVPWGILVVCDALATDRIPEWPDEDALVVATATTVVVKVRHEVDGFVDVKVDQDQLQAAGVAVFEGSLDVPSGRLTVGDVTRDQSLAVEVSPGPVAVRILTDGRHDSETVQVLLGVSLG